MEFFIEARLNLKKFRYHFPQPMDFLETTGLPLRDDESNYTMLCYNYIQNALRTSWSLANNKGRLDGAIHAKMGHQIYLGMTDYPVN